MHLHYLEQTHPDASIDDIDLIALKEFLGMLKLPLGVEKYLEPDTRLRGDVTDLVTHPPGGSQDEVPRNFALVLFGREPHRFFRGAYAIFSVYDGNDRTAPRSQRYEVFGPIPVLIRNIMERLQFYMGMQIDKAAEFMSDKTNRNRYSPRAVQEAIVNAFVHRDYHALEPVRVTVFNDRIEVTSPGGLYAPFDPEEVKKGNVTTSWRNPSLAWFMVSMQFAQNEGQGIRTIIADTRALADREPEFHINPAFFRINIPAYVPPPLKEQ